MLLSCCDKKVTKEVAKGEEDSDFLLPSRTPKPYFVRFGEPRPLTPPLKTAKHTPQATWFGALLRNLVSLYHLINACRI